MRIIGLVDKMGCCSVTTFFRNWFVVLSVGTTVLGAPAFAEDYEAAFRELAQLKAQQAETLGRIAALEERLRSACSTCEPELERLPVQVVSEPASTEGAASRLQVSSDFLLRYEGNYNESDVPNRERAVMRARIGGSYKVSDAISVGGLLETGDPDDPNSGYSTLSGFADDMQVSLSRIYAAAEFGGVTVYGGKFPKPYNSTDLLWDGDVNPVGAGLKWQMKLNDRFTLDAAGIYFVIDESSLGDDSDMLGGQLQVSGAFSEAITVWLAAAYYDYELDSVEGADNGDFRSNLLDARGAYLSDYNIVDILGGVKYSGVSEDWPVSLVADYVKNTGASVAADSAFKVEVSSGRGQNPGDVKLFTSYSEAGVDAVLAAFSNDNFTLATNYRAYSFGLDYILTENVKVATSLFRYRTLNTVYARAGDDNDWQNRLRFNLILSF